MLSSLIPRRKWVYQEDQAREERIGIILRKCNSLSRSIIKASTWELKRRIISCCIPIKIHIFMLYQSINTPKVNVTPFVISKLFSKLCISRTYVISRTY